MLTDGQMRHHDNSSSRAGWAKYCIHFRCTYYKFIERITKVHTFLQHLRNCLLFNHFWFRACTVKYFQEVCGLCSHAWMNVRLQSMSRRHCSMKIQTVNYHFLFLTSCISPVASISLQSFLTLQYQCIWKLDKKLTNRKRITRQQRT